MFNLQKVFMKNLSLIGRNISHSKSEYIYKNLLNKEVNYQLIERDVFFSRDEILNLFHSVDGLSITSPFKVDAFNICDEYSLSVSSVNSINTMKVVNGKIIGENTDLLALRNILKNYSNHALYILGDGAMANIIKFLCQESNRPYSQFSRKVSGPLNDIETDNLKGIWFNCCSREFEARLKLEQNNIFYDLNYNMPGNRDFYIQNNIEYIDGMELLLEQARLACQFWSI